MSLSQEILHPALVPTHTGNLVNLPTTFPQEADSAMVLLNKIAASVAAGGGGGGGSGGLISGAVDATIVNTGDLSSQMKGVAVDPATVSFSYPTGQQVPVSVDSKNGALLANIRVLERGEDSISVSPYQFNTVSSSSVSSGVGYDEVFTLDSGEVGYIVNIGTGAIAWKYGPGASSTSLNGVINPAPSEGLQGGEKIIDSWIGAVSVAPFGSSEIQYIAYKMSWS